MKGHSHYLKKPEFKRYEGFTFSSTRVSEPGHGREETLVLHDVK